MHTFKTYLNKMVRRFFLHRLGSATLQILRHTMHEPHLTRFDTRRPLLATFVCMIDMQRRPTQIRGSSQGPWYFRHFPIWKKQRIKQGPCLGPFFQHRFGPPSSLFTRSPTHPFGWARALSSTRTIFTANGMPVAAGPQSP